MGDVSAEPTMEEILSSIKRVIEESEATPARNRRPARANSPRDAADEVLELNERVPFPEPAAREEPMATPMPTPPAATATVATQSTANLPPRAEPILSRDTAEASRGPLEALSRMIVRPDEAGSDTLEGLVREMLRPMLREWLDSNLPGIVETMVAKEIARISDRGA